MILPAAGFRYAVAAWMGARFVELLLWVKGARGIRCRDCGLLIAPLRVADFVSRGCPDCDGVKLELVHDQVL